MGKRTRVTTSCIRTAKATQFSCSEVSYMFNAYVLISRYTWICVLWLMSVILHFTSRFLVFFFYRSPLLQLRNSRLPPFPLAYACFLPTSFRYFRILCSFSPFFYLQRAPSRVVYFINFCYLFTVNKLIITLRRQKKTRWNSLTPKPSERNQKITFLFYLLLPYYIIFPRSYFPAQQKTDPMDEEREKKISNNFNYIE